MHFEYTRINAWITDHLLQPPCNIGWWYWKVGFHCGNEKLGVLTPELPCSLHVKGQGVHRTQLFVLPETQKTNFLTSLLTLDCLASPLGRNTAPSGELLKPVRSSLARSTDLYEGVRTNNMTVRRDSVERKVTALKVLPIQVGQYCRHIPCINIARQGRPCMKHPFISLDTKGCCLMDTLSTWTNVEVIGDL